MRFRHATALIRFAVVLRAVLCVVTPTGALGAQASVNATAEDLTPNSEVALVSESNVFRAGSTTTLALRITMDPGWHTYWTNPGDAGLPLDAVWTLPVGVTVSAPRFPTPHVLPLPPLMSYGYEREVLVLVDVTVAPTVPIGTTLTLAADIEFLVCADVCLPASEHVMLAARTARQPSPSVWAQAIAATRAQLVRPVSDWTVMAWRDGARIMLFARIPKALQTSMRAPHVIADSTGVLEHAAVQRVRIAGDTIVLALTRAGALADSTSRFSGVLLTDVNDPRFSYQLDVPISRAPPRASALVAMIDGAEAIGTGGAPSNSTGTSDHASSSAQLVEGANDAAADIGVMLALLLAFVGGVILNLMPCVFPVLSIKILSFVERGGDDGGAVGRRHAFVFTMGVLTMFWVLAGVLLVLRAGGAQLGWGFQLQSPAVVAALALVVFALALNLSGVFAMGMSLTRLGRIGSGMHYGDSFLTGLLAVIVATPCTAPFMGAALGYALTQNAVIGLAVFTALGLGLSAPYVILASSPALLRRLPRPGPWLETLKQSLAFPLYATVVWLLWVLGRQAGTDLVSLVLLFVVGVALAGWMAGRAQNAGHTRRSSVALALLLLTIVGGGAATAVQPVTPVRTSEAPPGWEPWSATRVAAARDSGRAVFVDFTAAWCLSCQVNERVALQTDAVERAFAAGNVLLLRADWTSRDSSITAILSTFGRSGVPLYVLYSRKRHAPAELLPAVLTPGAVIGAVTRATSANVTSRSF